MSDTIITLMGSIKDPATKSLFDEACAIFKVGDSFRDLAAKCRKEADLHPAWDRSDSRISLNAVIGLIKRMDPAHLCPIHLEWRKEILALESLP